MGLSRQLLASTFIGAISLSGLVRPALAQQVAGSVESGLQGLAQEIVAKSVAQDRNSIAVLPFPNADSSCSVLSTYIADELIQALFSLPNSSLTIIERNQLEAIINEIQIGAGGLLNPETTQSLGKVSGVKALTVGTITQIGDRIRINARLVATDTGRTISAAAVSIPRTADIDSLLRQPVAGEGGTCGVRITARSQGAYGPSAQSTAAPPAAIAASANPTVRTTRTAISEGLSMMVQTVIRSQDKKTITAIVSILSKDREQIKLAATAQRPFIMDDEANSAEIASITGVQVCRNWEIRAQDCKGIFSNIDWTALTPDVPITVVMKFHSKDGVFTGRSIALSAAFLKAPFHVPDGFKPFSDIKDVSVNFADLPILEVSRR